MPLLHQGYLSAGRGSEGGHGGAGIPFFFTLTLIFPSSRCALLILYLPFFPSEASVHTRFFPVKTLGLEWMAGVHKLCLKPSRKFSSCQNVADCNLTQT